MVNGKLKKSIFIMLVVLTLVFVFPFSCMAYSVTNDPIENFNFYCECENYSVYTHRTAASDAMVYHPLGDYIIMSTSTTGDFEGLYFIYYEGKMYTVDDAYAKGIIDEQELVSKLPKYAYKLNYEKLGDYELIYHDKNRGREYYFDKAASIEQEIYQRLDEYTVFSDKTSKYLTGRYYVKLNNEWYSMKEAFDFRYLDEKELKNILPEGSVFVSGDVNSDEELSILDATYIQKHLASLEFEGDFISGLADFDCDNNITITDVTAIQKKLAKLN